MGSCYSHIIKRRVEKLQQIHEEEGDLENGVLDEVQRLDNIIVPRRGLKIGE